MFGFGGGQSLEEEIRRRNKSKSERCKREKKTPVVENSESLNRNKNIESQHISKISLTDNISDKTEQYGFPSVKKIDLGLMGNVFMVLLGISFVILTFVVFWGTPLSLVFTTNPPKLTDPVEEMRLIELAFPYDAEMQTAIMRGSDLTNDIAPLGEYWSAKQNVLNHFSNKPWDGVASVYNKKYFLTVADNLDNPNEKLVIYLNSSQMSTAIVFVVQNKDDSIYIKDSLSFYENLDTKCTVNFKPALREDSPDFAEMTRSKYISWNHEYEPALCAVSDSTIDSVSSILKRLPGIPSERIRAHYFPNDSVQGVYVEHGGKKPVGFIFVKQPKERIGAILTFSTGVDGHPFLTAGRLVGFVKGVFR